MRERKLPQPFTSRQSGPQLLLALLWLPVHLLLLPRLLWQFFPQWDESTLNVAVYAVGAVYMLLTQFSFLRRDFDPLCEHPLRVLLEVLVCYGAMLLFNLAVNGILMLILGRGENPNNAAVVDMAVQTGGPITALAIFLAPLVEEIIFRAGLFGGLRRRNRAAAYVLSIAVFALYHVWSYAWAARDPLMLLYALQYVPISYLLCRCYERTNSVWGSILLHMLVNFISLKALLLLEQLL